MYAIRSYYDCVGDLPGQRRARGFRGHARRGCGEGEADVLRERQQERPHPVRAGHHGAEAAEGAGRRVRNNFV